MSEPMTSDERREEEEEYPDVRGAIQRALERGRESEGLFDLVDEIREITFFDQYMAMKVVRGPLLERLNADESLRSDLELSLSAAFGRPMELRVHRFS